ncbi:MAG: hypothetical protein WA144_01280 [Candidatus Methanoperedens sp.]
MKKIKRCPDCTRPVCQRVLTLRGCKEKPIEEITGVPLNPYSMHDLFTTG